MASIGGITCTFVRGAMPVMKLRSEKWQLPGINGYGLALTGYGDSEFGLRAVLYGTLAEVGAWAISMSAKQGLIVTVINDLGQTNTRAFLDQVGVVNVSPAKVPGTTVTHRGEIEIRATTV